jgi:hypothetical protein
MRKIRLSAAAAFVALAACGKNADAPAAGEPGGEAAAALSQPAARLIDGDPASAWIELTGVWAEKGRCQDDLARWIIEPEAFHLYEMHCAVEKLELLENGVKATAQCSIESDNDGLADVFYFIRQADASLTIVQADNDAMSSGLFLCDSEETEL